MELELLKEIPGYKAILKSVIKTQIQLLIEQLSNHTGEESIILTASLNEGTLSHLGSTMGKGFLEGRDEIKSHFLAYCLRSQQRRAIPEPQPRTSFPEERPPDESGSAVKRQKVTDPYVNPSQDYHNTNQTIMPVPVQLNTFTSNQEFNQPFLQGPLPHSLQGPSPHSPVLKRRKPSPAHSSPSFQHNDNQESENSINSQTGQPFNMGSDSGTDLTKMESSDSNNDSNIKLEPVEDGELELEITGVELGSVGAPGSGAEGFQGDWGQDASVGYPHSESGDSSMNQSGSLYNPSPTQSSHPRDQHYLLDPSQLRHQCIYCNKKFLHLSKLKRHLLSHTDQRPFQCELCPGAFKRKDGLVEHLKNVHKMFN